MFFATSVIRFVKNKYLLVLANISLKPILQEAVSVSKACSILQDNKKQTFSMTPVFLIFFLNSPHS